jgi:tRNA pseudouridine55 synthase
MNPRQGILLVDKQANITSYDVIRRLKKYLPHNQKIGHAGTLDPFATGLLIILLGRATKLMELILKLKKKYFVEGEFGYETDTNDPEGKIIHETNEQFIFDEEEIISVLDEFKGDIKQVPPIYSAKKVKGKKAYELAREGKKPDLPPKLVHIYRLELGGLDDKRIKLKVVCSSGTYIRKLVADIGRKLGVYCTAVQLRRLEIGPFNVKDAVKSDKDLLDIEVIDESLISLEKARTLVSG